MKNHESRPTGSTLFPEANATSHYGKEKYHANSSGRGRRRWYEYGQGGPLNNSYSYQKWDKDDNKQKKDKMRMWPMYVTAVEEKDIGLWKQGKN